MGRSRRVGLGTAVVAVILIAGSATRAWFARTQAQAAVALPAAEPALSGGSAARAARSAGAAWSVDPDTEAAVAEVVAKSSGEGGGDKLTMLFYTPHHDPVRVAAGLARAKGGHGRSVAMTTHDGILASDGYHAVDTGVMGALAVDLSTITAGLGAASFGDGSPAVATKRALAQALADAHRAKTDKPSLLVVFSTMRSEETILAAIAEEIGDDVPLIGGTAAGMVSAMERRSKDVNSSMILDDQVIMRGVAITAFYAPKPFGLAYGGGFDRGSGKGGVITSSDARLIKTIDRRPAAEVYDEWLGGRIAEARTEDRNVQNMLALYPLVQTVTKRNATHNQFVRAWPSGDPAAPGSLRTGADVHDGETVYTSEGSENILLNHFSSLPRQAREATGGGRASAGLFFYCAGALQTIPREHRGVLAALVQRSMGDIPWIGLFSWGEQGSVPGIGYQHGNLMASTVLFPGSSAR